MNKSIVKFSLAVALSFSLLAMEKDDIDNLGGMLDDFGDFNSTVQLDLLIVEDSQVELYPNEDIHIYVNKYGQIIKSPDGGYSEDPLLLQFRMNPAAIVEYRKKYKKEPEKLYCQSDILLIYPKHFYPIRSTRKRGTELSALPELTKEIQLQGEDYVTMEGIRAWPKAADLGSGIYPARLIIGCWVAEPQDRNLNAGSFRAPADYMGQIMFAMEIKPSAYSKYREDLAQKSYLNKYKREYDKLLEQEARSKSYWVKEDDTLIGYTSSPQDYIFLNGDALNKGTRIFAVERPNMKCQEVDSHMPEDCHFLFGLTEEGRWGTFLDYEFSDQFVPKD